MATGDFVWSDHGDGTVSISGYTGTDVDVIIPHEIDGKTVVRIEEDAFRSLDLKNVRIPDGVTQIDRLAFGYNSLTHVRLPSSLQDMGWRAFYANDLETIDIPEGVQEIAIGAFSYSNLTHVEIPASVHTVDQNAFTYNQLTSVRIGNPEAVIMDNAFDNNLEEPADLIIHGYYYSTAQFMAEENGYTFRLLATAITEVPEISYLYVDYGTSLEDLDLPETADVRMTTGTSLTVPLNWDEGAPDFDGTSPGLYEFTAELDHPADITNPRNFEVTVMVRVFEPRIIGVGEFETIEVAYGTPEEDLPLPEEGTFIYADDSEETRSTMWFESEPEYDGETAGTYVFYGLFITEDQGPVEMLAFSVDVIVLPEEVQDDVPIEEEPVDEENPVEEEETVPAEEENNEETSEDTEEKEEAIAGVKTDTTTGSSLPQTNQQVQWSLYGTGLLLITMAGLLYIRQRRLA